MTIESNLSSNNQEWEIEKAVSIFNTVRNIPYRLGLDGNSDKLLPENVGNCTRKHLYLLPRLSSLGYKVTICVAEFDWRKLPIPRDILTLLKDPLDTHLFLEVSRQNKIMTIDATWNPQMPIGFPISEWDGVSSTPVGTEPLRIWKEDYNVLKIKSTASTTLRFLQRMVNHPRPTPFNDAFNLWLKANVVDF